MTKSHTRFKLLFMKSLSTLLLSIIFALMFCNHLAYSIETAPHISDREIVERLTRFEEGQGALRGEVKQIREDINKQFDRMDKQFDRLVNIVLCIIGVFAFMCGGTIWFALWDRRSMVRPFEEKVEKIEYDIAENRNKLYTRRILRTRRNLKHPSIPLLWFQFDVFRRG